MENKAKIKSCRVIIKLCIYFDKSYYTSHRVQIDVTVNLLKSNLANNNNNSTINFMF